MRGKKGGREGGEKEVMNHNIRGDVYKDFCCVHMHTCRYDHINNYVM